MKLKIKKLSSNSKLPTKATSGSACYDVYSRKRILLSPMEKALVPTGLSFELPPGFGMDIRPRSGLALKGLVILNSPGTLDSDYRGELMVPSINLSSGNILIDKGDRIAQIRLFKTIDIEFEEVEELSETERGVGGFGSTGK
jgi:dUTP pyrophosphatase